MIGFLNKYYIVEIAVKKTGVVPKFAFDLTNPSIRNVKNGKKVKFYPISKN